MLSQCKVISIALYFSDIILFLTRRKRKPIVNVRCDGAMEGYNMTIKTRMTPGEAAYLEDVRRQPVYPFNGKPRTPWAQLGDEIRANWERYPTPREWKREG